MRSTYSFIINCKWVFLFLSFCLSTINMKESRITHFICFPWDVWGQSNIRLFCPLVDISGRLNELKMTPVVYKTVINAFTLVCAAQNMIYLRFLMLQRFLNDHCCITTRSLIISEATRTSLNASQDVMSHLDTDYYRDYSSVIHLDCSIWSDATVWLSFGLYEEA